MSVYAMSSVWKLSQHEASDLLVLLAVADYANDEGEAWPSVEALMRKARLSERAVRYSIRRLVASGEMTVAEDSGPVLPSKQGRKRGAKATLYTVALGTGKSCKPCSTSAEVPQMAMGSPANGDTSPTPPIKDGPISTDPPEEGSSPAATFEAFWTIWPHDRKCAKKQAFGFWAKLPTEDRLRAIAEVGWRVAHDPWWRGPRPDGVWAIPHPHRYLRDRRFEDARPAVTITRETIQQQTRSSNAAALAKLPVTILYD